jgi:hypothetical protein
LLRVAIGVIVPNAPGSYSRSSALDVELDAQADRRGASASAPKLGVRNGRISGQRAAGSFGAAVGAA